MGHKKSKKQSKSKNNEVLELKESTKPTDVMTYKYPPIYKYGFLLLVVYMLMKHQKIMSQDKLLTNTIIITLIVGFVDFVIINNHPFLFNDNSESFEDSDVEYSDDFDDYDDDNFDDYDLSIEKEIESLNSKHSGDNHNNKYNGNNSNNGQKSNAIQINYLKQVPQGDMRQYYSTDMLY